MLCSISTFARACVTARMIAQVAVQVETLKACRQWAAYRASLQEAPFPVFEPALPLSALPAPPGRRHAHTRESTHQGELEEETE